MFYVVPLSGGVVPKLAQPSHAALRLGSIHKISTVSALNYAANGHRSDVLKALPANTYNKATWLGFNRLDPEKEERHTRDPL